LFKKYGSGTLLTVGVVMAVVGILLQTDIITDALGLILIVVGIAVGIIGLYNMLTSGDTGKKGSKKSTENE
jgi:cadmium resistance protein CadD (predicted permease)